MSSGKWSAAFTWALTVRQWKVNPSTCLRASLKSAADGGCDYSIDYQCKAAIPLWVKKCRRVHHFTNGAGGLEQEIRWLKKNCRAFNKKVNDSGAS